jgi:glycosyltransferase involved in cell wall biosynthesis
MKQNTNVSVSDWPRISVVIPSLNQGRFLRMTLDSIVAQDYPNTEIILIDGGSTDGTLEVIREYEQALAYWVSRPDGGQFEAIRLGLEKCTGDLACYQNSDDYYLQGTFWKLAHIYKTRPTADFIYGNTLIVDQDNRVIRHVKQVPASLEALYYRGFFCLSQSTFWNTRLNIWLLPAMRQIDLTFSMEQYMWGVLLAHSHDVVFMREPLGCFRSYEGCKTSQIREKMPGRAQYVDEVARIRRMAEETKLIGSYTHGRFCYYMARRLFYLAIQGDCAALARLLLRAHTGLEETRRGAAIASRP